MKFVAAPGQNAQQLYRQLQGACGDGLCT